MSRPSWIGHKLGNRYEIEELLGEGGMAAVYRATDPNLKRVVAIKMIHPHLSRDEEFVRRFEAEASSVAQLRHPNIIQVYDFDRDEDVFYIVFEFLPGETLQEHIGRLSETGRTMPYEQVAKIGGDLAGALQYAHERGLVHRDVKPANVMLNFSGGAVLMDFGIVKITGGTQHTATGAVLGTARYMAPEQIRGESSDHRTDIYALGIMLFQMVTGRLPYEADSAMTLMMMQVNDPVPDLRQLRADVPPDLARIITKALAKRKDDRYQSAEELARDLRNAGTTPGTGAATAMLSGGVTPPADPFEQTSEPRAAAPPHPVTTPGSTSAAPPPNQPPAPTPSQTTTGGGVRRRLPFLAGCLALLLVALCAGGTWALFGTEWGNQLLGREVAGVTPTEEATATAELTEEPGAENGATATVTPNDEDATPTAETGAADAATAEAEALAATAQAQAYEAATAEAQSIAATEEAREAQAPLPTPTERVPPTNTPAPQPTATYTPAPQPTNTAAPAGPTVRITNIGLSGDTYIVDYTTTGYTEALPGMHVHFFFNTVPPEQAGVPGGGPWYVWGGPRPFNGYKTGDRPGNASQMCALVANTDHSIILNSGNCVALP